MMANDTADTPPSHEPVGRTYADAVVEVVRLLGKLAPVVILMVVAIGAFYVAQSQYQEQLKTATTQLVETYKAIGDVSTKHIANLKGSLEVHQQVTKSIEQERLKLQGAKDELATARSERELEEAKTRQAVQDFQSMEKKLFAAGSKVDVLKKKIQELQKKNTLATARNTKLNADLQRLISAIESSDLAEKNIIALTNVIRTVTDKDIVEI